MSRVWSKYEVVQYIPRTPSIVLVGETHEAEQSRTLVQNVFEAEDWGAVCVELCSSRVETDESGHLRPCTTHANHGITAALNSAQETKTPIALVDMPELVSRLRAEAALKLNSDADALGTLSSNISVRETGDIPLREIEEYLDTLREDFPRMYEAVHGERNTILAKHINRVHNWADGPVLAVVGAAHLIPLSEELWRAHEDTETGYPVPVHTHKETIEL